MSNWNTLPKIKLGVYPTPFYRLENISRIYNKDIWIKRDDLCGVALGGNKVRKLEYLLADAQKQGCDTVFTTGGAQSNHAMLTAACAARLGMRCTLILKKRGVTDHKGNLILDDIFNAQVEFMDTDSYEDIYAEMRKRCEILAANGRKGYIIPVGGSTALGAIGYAECVREMAEQAKEAGIPIVCESVALDNQDSYVGIADYEAAYAIGVWMGENAEEDLKVLVVGQPVYEACRNRVQGFLDGLKSTGAPYEVVQEVDGNGAKEDSLTVCTDALTAHPEVNVIFGINDNSATGGMNAYLEQGLDPEKLTVLGFGFEGAVGREALLGDTPYKAAVAMFPEYVGAKIVDAAIDAANGEAQELYQVPTVVITKDNFDQFYIQDEEGNYLTNFDAIDKLLAEQNK